MKHDGFISPGAMMGIFKDILGIPVAVGDVTLKAITPKSLRTYTCPYCGKTMVDDFRHFPCDPADKQANLDASK